MTKEKQRIALAVARGWKHDPSRGDWCMLQPSTQSWWCVCMTPDYLNDLNAMAEAEETLTDIEFMKYAQALHDRFSANPLRNTVCADASARAEAFLKTKGLWKP